LIPPPDRPHRRPTLGTVQAIGTSLGLMLAEVIAFEVDMG
jgi:hypothetical protein